MNIYSVDKLMAETRQLACEYRRATGRTLAVSSEIAKYDASRLLGLNLEERSDVGYDAVGTGPREGLRVQIKGRAIFDEKKSGQRIGQIKQGQSWDLLVLVMMDADFQATEIFEAERDVIFAALGEQPAGGRGRRGVMSVTRFRGIARLAWTSESGLEDDDIWTNDAAND